MTQRRPNPTDAVLRDYADSVEDNTLDSYSPYILWSGDLPLGSTAASAALVLDEFRLAPVVVRNTFTLRAYCYNVTAVGTSGNQKIVFQLYSTEVSNGNIILRRLTNTAVTDKSVAVVGNHKASLPIGVSLPPGLYYIGYAYSDDNVGTHSTFPSSTNIASYTRAIVVPVTNSTETPSGIAISSTSAIEAMVLGILNTIGIQVVI